MAIVKRSAILKTYSAVAFARAIWLVKLDCSNRSEILMVVTS